MRPSLVSPAGPTPAASRRPSPLGQQPRAKAPLPRTPPPGQALLRAVSRPPPQTASGPHRPKPPGAPLPPLQPTGASAREPPPAEVSGAGAAGKAPTSLAYQRASRQAPRGVSAGSVGQARGGFPAPRLGGPAGGRRMYTLLSGLYKYMFQKDEYCVLILGLDNAGKTTFLEQSKTRFNKNYKGMSLSKITTTVGLNIGTVDVGKARLMFWDLGGQEELQSLWDKYYAECHGVIYVIDSTDEERLSESKQAFEKMVTSEALDGVPILVLANKQDVETCLSIPDIKTAFSECGCPRRTEHPHPWVLPAVLAPLHQRQQCPIPLQPWASCWADPGKGL
uniref:ADP-ribosylation factor-related protein 1 n=1 Tax=Bos mutus grunniens TaxID=30521 RepID=A0A8B9XSW6_BOSMU